MASASLAKAPICTAKPTLAAAGAATGGDVAGAIAQIQAAGAAARNDAAAQAVLGRALVAQGQGPEGLAALEHAIGLDAALGGREEVRDAVYASL